MAADRTGLGDRTPLPVALSAPWRPWHSLRHGLVYLSLVEPGFRLPARYQLNPAPCGRLAGLRCSLTTRPLSRGVIPRQEPPSLNGPQEPAPLRLRSAPQRQFLFRRTSETAGSSGGTGFVSEGAQVVSVCSGWASKMASFGNSSRSALSLSNSSTARCPEGAPWRSAWA